MASQLHCKNLLIGRRSHVLHFAKVISSLVNRIQIRHSKIIQTRNCWVSLKSVNIMIEVTIYLAMLG